MLVLLFHFDTDHARISFGCAFSLTKVSSAARVFDEGNIQLVSYKALYRSKDQTLPDYATAIAKNISDEERVQYNGGYALPYINQNTVKLDNLEVIMDGRRQHDQPQGSTLKGKKRSSEPAFQMVHSDCQT